MRNWWTNTSPCWSSSVRWRKAEASFRSRCAQDDAISFEPGFSKRSRKRTITRLLPGAQHLPLICASREPELILEPTYSIVIPAYNEGSRLGPTLERVLAYVHAQRWDAEVIVVNDGSRDNTAEIIRAFAAKDPMLRLVENPGNRGKGYSVRNGMLSAHGGVVLFSDADLSSPIEEAPKLFAALSAGADIAIGSRWLRAETQTQRQPLHRQIFGRVFNLLLRLTLGLKFKDTQCGFKAFKQSAVQAIFPLQRIERWGFDPEILFLARKFGFKVQEVPVAWGHSGDTRIHPLVDGSRMFLEMLHIRWNDLTGKYGGQRGARRQAGESIPESRGPRS
jgi:glycosyltransferase involved in cell wall biosynthesis